MDSILLNTLERTSTALASSRPFIKSKGWFGHKKKTRFGDTILFENEELKRLETLLLAKYLNAEHVHFGRHVSEAEKQKREQLRMQLQQQQQQQQQPPIVYQQDANGVVRSGGPADLVPVSSSPSRPLSPSDAAGVLERALNPQTPVDREAGESLTHDLHDANQEPDPTNRNLKKEGAIRKGMLDFKLIDLAKGTAKTGIVKLGMYVFILANLTSFGYQNGKMLGEVVTADNATAQHVANNHLLENASNGIAKVIESFQSLLQVAANTSLASGSSTEGMPATAAGNSSLHDGSTDGGAVVGLAGQNPLQVAGQNPLQVAADEVQKIGNEVLANGTTEDGYQLVTFLQSYAGAMQDQRLTAEDVVKDARGVEDLKNCYSPAKWWLWGSKQLSPDLPDCPLRAAVTNWGHAAITSNDEGQVALFNYFCLHVDRPEYSLCKDVSSSLLSSPGSSLQIEQGGGGVVTTAAGAGGGGVVTTATRASGGGDVTTAAGAGGLTVRGTGGVVTTAAGAGGGDVTAAGASGGGVVTTAANDISNRAIMITVATANANASVEKLTFAQRAYKSATSRETVNVAVGSGILGAAGGYALAATGFVSPVAPLVLGGVGFAATILHSAIFGGGSSSFGKKRKGVMLFHRSHMPPLGDVTYQKRGATKTKAKYRKTKW
jgi:hypothetical protein